jgi:hypothetical protein
LAKWWRRIRGGIVVGLLWAFGWALLSIPMELFVDPAGDIVDIWPMVLAIPGFLAGTGFAMVLAAAERRRRFEELSLVRVAAWGAVAGVLLGAAVVASLSGGVTAVLSLQGASVAGSVTLLSAASAVGTLAMARKGEGREVLESGEGRHES